MICVFKNFYGVKWYEHAINLIALTVNICMLRSRHTSVTTADIGWVSIASTLFCTYLSHFSTVLDDFFFGSARQIKHPIFTGQGAGQRSHTPGMTRAIAYIQVEVVVVVASVCHWWWCHMPNLVILEMIDCIFVHKPPKPRPELRLTAWKYWSPSRGPLKPYLTACDGLGYLGLGLARLQGSGPSLNITTAMCCLLTHLESTRSPRGLIFLVSYNVNFKIMDGMFFFF